MATMLSASWLLASAAVPTPWIQLSKMTGIKYQHDKKIHSPSMKYAPN